jgi:hypothetical protein
MELHIKKEKITSCHGEHLVGLPAKPQPTVNSANTVFAFKRIASDWLSV